jgi:hypothetical protein
MWVSDAAGRVRETSRLAAMRGTRLLTLALMLGVTVVGLASCGGGSSDKLIPPANSAALLAALDQVSSQAGDGNCDTAAAATDQVLRLIDQLPDTVDQKLKQDLIDGVNRLKRLTQDPKACKPAQTTTTVTQTQTTTVPTTPTQTQTQTTTTGGTPGGGVGPNP